ncbi:methyl-accepting chemotaxis protein [Lysinibacillus antri]|uniref:Methyl-accepting chemotaxis protein n=1 Tax=Lysinibacillus antri TaxID=2498145 RepID=A0A432LCY6_9BACI|nr:methyl-accepting chemotaxis protein [Lysinibacillus antri]RUL53118.1 methyl-accepting chemotaxis protein [Lysinibacillus antri]
MSIGGKLSLSFYSLIVLICISVGVSFFNLNTIDKNMDELLDKRLAQMLNIEEMRYSLAMQGLLARQIVIDDSNSIDSLITFKELFDEEFATLKEASKSDVMNGYISEVEDVRASYNYNMETAIKEIQTGNTSRAIMIINGSLSEDSKNLTGITDKMFEYQTKQLDQIHKQSDSSMSSAKTISTVVLIASLLVSIYLVIYVKRSITIPLRNVVKSVSVVSTGNLTEEDLKVRTKDEIGQLSQAFNTMKGNLKSLIVNVQSSTEHLSAAAEELSASTEEITASTEDIEQRVGATAEQAKVSAQAANESARSMDETAAGVQRIAESTQVLHNSSIEANDTATHGTTILQQAERQMETISHSTTLVNDLVQRLSKQTEEIESISKVITDITEQTNLLALNAAIEAARAGEHGKGFAVVAEEVRKLAEESKMSASQIFNLTVEIKSDTDNVEKAVSESLTTVNDGVKVIGAAGESFKTIVHSVEKMKTQIEEISATSEQISASAEQVSASVNEISNGSSESAKDVEMIAAAIEEQAATMEQVNHVAVELSVKAQELQNEIQKFKI